ncbi:putative small proline-rich protein 5 [Cataglyphis hispanica]|uniref:putative small proline-rich protein 5 n=1 Tax=Cataglyphis hispanica TaxID=1086592 RepID=UPI00217F4E46|nr:putative small proline-rich protein 5 [Cataglyphis hispanica]
MARIIIFDFSIICNNVYILNSRNNNNSCAPQLPCCLPACSIRCPPCPVVCCTPPVSYPCMPYVPRVQCRIACPPCPPKPTKAVVYLPPCPTCPCPTSPPKLELTYCPPPPPCYYVCKTDCVPCIPPCPKPVICPSPCKMICRKFIIIFLFRRIYC